MIIQFRVPKDLEQEITSRNGGSYAATAKRDLKRYYRLLEYSLREINLTHEEGMLICDALNGVLFGEEHYHLLWAEVADAIRLDKLDEKWGVDGDALVKKLREASASAKLAVADAVERAWLIWGKDPKARDEEVLREVGLLRG